LFPRIDFRIHEFEHEGKQVVLFEVPAALHTPVRFQGTEYIRVGSYKKKLHDYPEKERALWAIFQPHSFEQGIAAASMQSDEVLALIDYPTMFELLGQRLPENRSGILERLTKENVIVPHGSDLYNITNLGAVLFAKQLDRFRDLSRKAMRVVLYKGSNRIETVKEQAEVRGYAVGFERLIAYINDQLPQNEQIGQALRREVRVYPEIAIRELVANALIHQDFSITGTGPIVEIFPDRIEIMNPGTPLIDTLRFIDEPPRSRNETLAAMMWRLNICEERGSGVDKVIFQVEFYQLPAPDFQVTSNHTKAVLFAPKKLSDMSAADRIRACYQHACLCWVSNKFMTNTSLRERFGIEEKNHAVASRIIAEAVKTGLVKPADPTSKSKKHAKYVPFWS
jgi:predicted HTH transcriptional regulator